MFCISTLDIFLETKLVGLSSNKTGFFVPSRPAMAHVKRSSKTKKEREGSPVLKASFNLTPPEFISLPEILPFYKYPFSCLVPRLNRILGMFGG